MSESIQNADNPRELIEKLKWQRAQKLKKKKKNNRETLFPTFILVNQSQMTSFPWGKTTPLTVSSSDGGGMQPLQL